MTFEVPTEKRDMELHLVIHAAVPCRVIVKGYDPDTSQTVYFRRYLGYRNLPGKGTNLVSGRHEFTIPMPLTPSRMMLEIVNDVEFNNVSVVSLKAVDLKRKGLWLTDTDRDYIKFIYEFVTNLGALKDGDVLASDSENFIIKCFPVLVNRETRQELSTPARINRKTAIIEVNLTKLKKYTLFMRIMILFHEYFHWKLDTQSEKRADFNAINWFLSLGFPQTEAMYAFTKVFPKGNSALTKREEENIEFIKNFHLLSA